METYVKIEYDLLPFRFERLDDGRELIVNEIGDYLIVPNGTVEKIIERKFSKTSNSTIYNKLHTNFFITEKNPPEYLRIITSRYATQKSFLDQFTALHIIVLTLRCNQDCRYCQVSKVRKESSKKLYDISEYNLMRTIDFIFQSPSDQITIEFQGGEPLLRFDLIQRAVEYSEQLNLEYGKTVTFVVCTNLTLVDSQTLEYFKSKNILISTSLDGPEELHNRNRPNKSFNSYEKVIEKINEARNILGMDRVSALMTASRNSLEYPEAIVDEYINQDFHEIFLRELNPYGSAILPEEDISYSIELFIDFYKKALDRIIYHNKHGKYFVEVFTKFILTKMLTPFPIGFVDLQSPAGIINNVLLYNHDGNIYPSDEARMLAEMGNNHFCLGSVNNEYPEIFKSKLTKELSQVWATEYIAGCSDCAFQSYCGADPIRNYSISKDIYGFRPTSNHCFKIKSICKYLILKMEEDSYFRKLAYQWASEQ